jgi:hypothetical protein
VKILTLPGHSWDILKTQLRYSEYNTKTSLLSRGKWKVLKEKDFKRLMNKKIEKQP